MRRDLTVDDFVAGLLAALVDKGILALSIRGIAFYRAIADSYGRLTEIAAEHDVDPRFAIVVDPLHGDSPIVRQAVSAVVLSDMASLDNPEYQDLRLKINRYEARQLLDQVPGGQALFSDLADAFLANYPYVAV
jgi:hypothetical protein